MSAEDKNISIYKYNMSIFYQSTIIYFVFFIIYVVIRGEIVEDSFKLIFKDPIIYLFGFIVLISLINLVYNLLNDKKLVISENEISIVSRFKTKSFSIKNISSIKISQTKRRVERRRVFRLIRIKLKIRKRPLIIRPYDYENEEDLLKKIRAIKEKVESENV